MAPARSSRTELRKKLLAKVPARFKALYQRFHEEAEKMRLANGLRPEDAGV